VRLTISLALVIISWMASTEMRSVRANSWSEAIHSCWTLETVKEIFTPDPVTFDVAKFQEAKEKYSALFNQDRRVTFETVRKSDAPKTPEEVLAMLESACDVRISGFISASEAWTGAQKDSPKVQKVRKDLDAALKSFSGKVSSNISDRNAPWTHKDALNMLTKLQALTQTLVAIRQERPGLFESVLGAWSGVEGAPASWKEALSGKYRNGVSDLTRKVIAEDLIRLDVVPFMQQMGFVAEMGLKDRVGKFFAERPARKSIALQLTAELFAKMMTGTIFMPFPPKTKFFGFKNLDRTLQNEVANSKIKSYAELEQRIRQQLGSSPEAQYIYNKVRAFFIAASSAVVVWALWEILDEPEMEVAKVVLEAATVTKSELKADEEKRDVKQEAIEKAWQAYKTNHPNEVNAETEAEIKRVSALISLENPPVAVIGEGVYSAPAGVNADAVRDVVNQYYILNYVYSESELRIHK